MSVETVAVGADICVYMCIYVYVYDVHNCNVQKTTRRTNFLLGATKHVR